MLEGKDIEKLASLARIAITPEERDAFLTEIEPILGYVAQIKEITAQVKDKQLGLTKNVLREDIHPHESGLYTKDILLQAPDREGDYIKVKKILE